MKLKMTNEPTGPERILGAVSERLAEKADRELEQRIEKAIRPLCDMVNGRLELVTLDLSEMAPSSFITLETEPRAHNTYKNIRAEDRPQCRLRVSHFLEALRQDLFERYRESNREAAFSKFVQDQRDLEKWAKLRAEEMLANGEAVGEAAIEECQHMAGHDKPKS